MATLKQASNVLIAVDGSEGSFETLKYVNSFTWPQETNFDVVNIVEVVPVDSKVLGELGSQRVIEYNQELENKSKVILDKCQGHFKSGLKAQFKTVKSLNAAEALVHWAKDHKTDIIALGARGLNPVKKFFLGSVSDQVLRTAPCSVLIHRDHVGHTIEPAVRSAVLGFSDTKASDLACDFVSSRLNLSALNLASVFQLSYHYGLSYSISVLQSWPELKKPLEESLYLKCEYLKKKMPETEVKAQMLDDAFDVAHALNEYAKTKKASLIVVGTEDKNAFDRALIGSISSRLVHNSDLPVLVVR